MTTEEPFITELRTNLNAFNAHAKAREIQDSGPKWGSVPGMALNCDDAGKRKRRIKRKRTLKIFGRVVAWSVAAGFGIGTLMVASTIADASIANPTKAEIVKVRELGGIPPCKHEDGSAQRGICWFDSRNRGNGDGDVIVLVPVKGEDDKKVVVLINR